MRMIFSLQTRYSQTPGTEERVEPSILSYRYVACASWLVSFLLSTRRWKERVLESLGFHACIKNDNSSYVPHSRTSKGECIIFGTEWVKLFQFNQKAAPLRIMVKQLTDQSQTSSSKEETNFNTSDGPSNVNKTLVNIHNLSEYFPNLWRPNSLVDD